MSSIDPNAGNTRLLAGEYVLGTLSIAQRREVEQRIPHDADLATAVRKWEARLLPLTELAEPQTPSPELWQRIEHSLSFATDAATDAATIAAPRKAEPVRNNTWWNSLTLWRGLAASGFAAAALLIAVLVTQQRPVSIAPPASSFMVVLTSPQDKAPGWIVQISADRQLSLTPLQQTAVPAAKSLQFWTKADGWSGPVSLGLVKAGQTLKLPLDKLPPLQANQLFEITLEPQYGSPIGKPTGPVLFIGRAIKVS